MTESVKPPRLFYALWPCPALAWRLARAQRVVHGGRPTHVQDFHLTLVFLGNQPGSRLPDLIKLLDELPTVPQGLVLDQYGSFGGNAVVWAGPSSPPPDLFALQKRLVERLEESGVIFRRENQYRPHITLARRAHLQEGATLQPIEWTNASLVLAESTGASAGPRYRVLACRPGDAALP